MPAMKTGLLPKSIQFLHTSSGLKIDILLKSLENDLSFMKLDPGLHRAFRSHLFGQDGVQRQIEDIMYGFIDDKKPKRPLVLSFHGSAGTGKNHVTRLIAESIYMKGIKSPYVHLYLPELHFPHQHDIAIYKNRLRDEIRFSLIHCPRQMFIFDEVEQLPEGLLDVVKPYIDYHQIVGDVDVTKALFIFLSNVGGKEIQQILLDHDSTRKSLRIRNFEKVLSLAAYNDKGDLRRSRLVESHLISHQVPFLALEREHVELCIEEEIVKMGHRPLTEDTMADVMGELEFNEEGYAVKGCKNIREKFNLFAYQQERERRRSQKYDL